jgi:hypothetical protein
VLGTLLIAEVEAKWTSVIFLKGPEITESNVTNHRTSDFWVGLILGQVMWVQLTYRPGF